MAETVAATVGEAAAAEVAAVAKPKLVFFHSPRSGRSRRVDGFVAQVLQRRIIDPRGCRELERELQPWLR